MFVPQILTLLVTCDDDTDQGRPGIHAASRPRAEQAGLDGLQGRSAGSRAETQDVLYTGTSARTHTYTLMQGSADRSLTVCTFPSQWAPV